MGMPWGCPGDRGTRGTPWGVRGPGVHSWSLLGVMDHHGHHWLPGATVVTAG